MQRLGGIIALTVGGIKYACKSDFDVVHAGVMRETIVGVDTVHGHKDSFVPARLTGTITVASDTNPAPIYDAQNVTVTIEQPDGTSFTITNATYTGERTANSGEGEVPVQFEGSQSTYLSPVDPPTPSTNPSSN